MRPENKWKTLQDKLVAAYLHDLSQSSNNKNFQCGSHLLRKLVERENLNCLAVNLYPGNEGYSLMLRTKTGTESETIKLPYEENEMLSYIDNEELPPLLIDLLEKSQMSIFYSGCVIVEVRDYRRSSNQSSYDSHHILLKPTTQSIVSDVAVLTNDGQKWTNDEKIAVEAGLLLATSEPLCLDPSVAVAITANGIHYHKNKLCSVPLKRLAKRHSQPALNKKRRFEHCAAPPQLRLYDVLVKHKRKLRTQPFMPLKTSKDNIDYWKQKEIPLEPPEAIEVDKYATVLSKPECVLDNTPETVEEYKLEVERGNGKVQVTNVTIMQRPTDEQFLGKLLVRREGQESGASCWFTMGDRSQVDKYISQFMEIYTEEGRKDVKITHLVPGKPPEVTTTPKANGT